MMTRKDFKEIADILASHQGIADQGSYHELVMDLARMCKRSNSNFNFDRFLEAAGAS